jgi:uncharacterized protein (TIGR02246 family)
MVEHTTDEATGVQVLQNYAAAVNAGDVEQWLSNWARSGVQMAPDAPMRRGHDEIREAMTPLFDLFDNTMTVTPESVRMAGDWGVVRGVFTHQATSKADGKEMRRAGKFMSIVERQRDGSWKMASDCFNYDAPAAAGTR